MYIEGVGGSNPPCHSSFSSSSFFLHLALCLEPSSPWIRRLAHHLGFAGCQTQPFDDFVAELAPGRAGDRHIPGTGPHPTKKHAEFSPQGRGQGSNSHIHPRASVYLSGQVLWPCLRGGHVADHFQEPLERGAGGAGVLSRLESAKNGRSYPRSRRDMTGTPYVAPTLENKLMEESGF